ncbi:hypothetical protein [Marinobacterium stanieri]|uniref:Uncharacterized protein n=1 Tax=Marinobacterium stanieri TaxID=49186 RepID=A0A1N6XC41_9GAMM|nr:hypothetical protein [Marinobacterium stanieri]SIQ99883.1 hypothetical protein SAMN05421647_11376 [Marinobacterium stanieri]
MDEKTPLTTNKPLNEWTPSGLKKSIFNEEGERTDEIFKEADQSQFHLSPQFDQWLKVTGGFFVLSTYQSGYIIFLGMSEESKGYFIVRAVGTAMGLAIVAARDQVWPLPGAFAGDIQAHENRKPYSCVPFCIVLEGIFATK